MQGDVESFYDIRGRDVRKKGRSQYGSKDFSLKLRCPYEWVEKQIDSLGDGSGKKFLDLCCGTGIHSVHPAKLGYQVTGVDLSPLSIEAAQTLSKQYETEANSSFHCEDASKVGEKFGTFDVIFVSGSLYYFAVSDILPTIMNLLNPGGHFFAVETFGDNPLMNTLRRLRHRKGERDSQTMSRLWGADEITAMREYFETSDVRYFDCLTLGTNQPTLHSIAAKMDQWLLTDLGVHSLAFKFTIHGTKK